MQARLGSFQEVGVAEEPDAIFVRSADLKNQELPKSLIAVCRAGSGIDNIPIAWCNKSGVVVFNALGAGANSVRDLVISMMILAARNILPAISFSEKMGQDYRHAVSRGSNPEKVKATIQEKIEAAKAQFKGSELRNKKILIVGIGTIGSLVAETCKHFGMKVYGFDPYAPAEKFADIMKINLLGDCPPCDFITIHASSNQENAGLVDRVLLERQTAAILFNFARGNLVQKEALSNALSAGKVRLYISDFFDPRLKVQFPDKTLFTPHIGASTAEAESGALESVVNKLARFKQRGEIEGAVNFPNCELKRSGNLRIFVSNFNVPGELASITGMLRDEGYNVSGSINQSRGNVACTITDLDSNPERNIEAVIEKIRTLPGVTGARLIN